MKFFKKVLKHLVSPFAVGLAATFVITYISVVYYSSRHLTSKEDHTIASLIQQFHEKTIDWRLTDRGQTWGSDQVAILAIDEKSLEQEGHWPWPREKLAKLTELAVEDGAKSVSFDIIWPEEDQKASTPALKRIKKTLANHSQLTADASQLIDQELGQNDGDKVFGETVKKYSDHLVLGAYYDEYQHLRSYADFCVDALFERTAEARYWKKESLPLTVIDTPLNELGFPKQIKDQLSDYFTLLEVSRSGEWFEKHKDLTPKITESLEDLNQILSPETYPGLATLWLNNDSDSMKTLLEQAKPELATPQGAKMVLARFGSAFTKKEAASLALEVREAGQKYCDRFLTDDDELLNLDAYKTLWGASKESTEQFAAMSWQSLWPKILATRQPANQGAPAETLEQAIGRIKSQSLLNSIPNIGRWWINIPQIADYTKHTGYFNAKQDTDGTIRRSILLVRRGNTYMPSLALKTFLLNNNYNAVAKLDLEDVGRKEARAKVLKSLEVNDADGNLVMRVPVDTEGHVMINYAGGRNRFPHVSAADILSDAPEMDIEVQVQDQRTHRWSPQKVSVNKKEFLKNKMLIAGATATGIYDLRVTPFEENYPGVETHANVLSNLLIEHARAKGERVPASAPGFLRSHPSEERVMWLVLIALGITLSALLSYYGSVAGLGITAAALTGIYAIDRIWLFGAGIVTTIIFPIFQVSGTYVTLTFYKYFTEERKKRELKGTFEKYVSPSIVAEVLADPENIELGGKKMDLTVMFSDVRGFTTISEKLDPRELSDLLNSYLTPMTELVFKNKGTLDKYMGDAIMAFWGAPIHFKDHAKHACRCALQMLVKLKELQDQYRAKGLPPIDIGIGLNTGEMSVGNMGSETVRSYTVMGDSVNLGSRLEGINKQYGTRIIISEFTHKEIKDTFVTREVDWVRVKGKAEPVRIFELIAEGKPKPEVEQFIQHFNHGFQLFHERKFREAVDAFNEVLKTNPDDYVSKLYIERCEDYLETPPEADWDGVCNMKTK